VFAKIPSQARGSYVLSFQNRDIGTIDVAGFVSYRARSETLVGNPQPFLVGGHVTLFAGLPDYTIVQFEPASGEIRRLLSGYRIGNSDVRAVGPTRNPSVFLLQPLGLDSVYPWHAKPLEAWDLSNTPVQVATYPRYSTSRLIAQLNDSVFLHAGPHQVQTTKNVDGVDPLIYIGGYEETSEIVLSPRGDRAAIRVHGSATGPPVFDTATGDTAYHVRQLFGAEGVAFSATGDTLFMLGYNGRHGDGPILVLVLKAASGQQLRQLELPAWIEDFAVDAAREMIYLAVVDQATYNGPGTLRLMVVDVRTMSVIGDMLDQDFRMFGCAYRRILVDGDAVFLVCGGDTWRFDRIDR
jgi:hypothetical protein